jgi:xylose dehydrogenase (NAD/NADP)
MSTPVTLNWGILGCARITRRGLIPGIAGSESGRLHALASRDIAKARAWAGEFGIPRSYGSYEEVLADPDVQAVYIPLPNELHRPWTIAAAEAGKHVLCDKPLACDAGEAEAMVTACRANGVLLMEGFMWRHQPRIAALRALVAEGAVGDLRLVRTSFSFSIEPGDWRLDPARGGGALWDIGCYGVNAARLFTGAEPISAQTTTRVGPTGVDMTLTTALEFPGGVLGLVDCSFELPFRCNVEVVGTRGAIEIPLAFLPPERPIARVLGAGTNRSAGAFETREFDGRDQYAAMVDAFAASVAARRLVAPAEDGLDQMRALAMIRAAERVVGSR